jgi:hypothetical protein
MRLTLPLPVQFQLRKLSNEAVDLAKSKVPRKIALGDMGIDFGIFPYIPPPFTWT